MSKRILSDLLQEKWIHLLQEGKNDTGAQFQERCSRLALKLFHEEQIKNNPPDIITCVPLHKKKLKLRGYNQSESIATGISESLNIPFNPNIILKLTHSDSQTKKSRFNRWLNVDTKFILNPAFDIKNKHVLIVDDVITTGATIETCGQLVLSQENTKTSFLSLCLSTN
jgi:ComF family protein